MVDSLHKIGLIGGLSWHSSAQYYRVVNAGVARACGADRSAPLVLSSLDFGVVSEARRSGQWSTLVRMLTKEARGLEAMGCEAVFLCSNTMHALLPKVQPQVGIPFVHIADALADAARQAGARRVGVLGTAHTMTQPFYASRLAAAGIDTVTPADVDALEALIRDELVRGLTTERGRAVMAAAIGDVVSQGAQAVGLCCTELHLVDPALPNVVVLDSMAAHADAALRWVLTGR